jgi:regulator of sirC expression with transglutaminase-like and TPR domain
MESQWVLAALRKIGKRGDDDFEIGEAALLLAALDRPLSDINLYLEHLAELANEVSCIVSSDPDQSLSKISSALAKIIATERRYTGDIHTYDDPQNANLMDVIDRRKGLPVGLAIIYLDVAHRLHWEATGINFPGQFLIRLEQGTNRQIVDPFNNGAVHDVSALRALLKQIAGLAAELHPDYYSPVSRRGTLIRLLNNIKQRAISAKNFERGAEILERMLLIAPRQMAILQEASVFYSKIGHFHRAERALETFLSRSLDEAERDEAEILLHTIQSRLN